MTSRLQYEWLKHTGPRPKIPIEVIRDMRRVDKNAFRRAWIHNGESLFWKGPYKEVYEKLKKRLIREDDTVYSGLQNEELYPLIRVMRETTEGRPGVLSHPRFPIRVRLPVIPREKLAANTIRLRCGQTVNHFDELFPGGVFDRDYIAKLNFTFIDAGIDPTYKVSIATRNTGTLRDEYVLEMNKETLKGFYDNSPHSGRLYQDLQARGYTLEAGELLTLYYTLESAPGRKEIPPIPL